MACKVCGYVKCPFARPPDPAPIPMLLWCPACGGRHVDSDAFASKPHHTHACQECGMVWRPAVVPTVGVDFLPGFRNGAADEHVPDFAKPTRAVPRGHCNRCDRCGFELASDLRDGCCPENCSWRPLPDRRDTCAGCGAPYKEAMSA